MSAIQYQALFVYSMIEDRANKFCIIYKIMGLKNLDYLLSQIFSFWIIFFCAIITLFSSLFFIEDTYNSVYLSFLCFSCVFFVLEIVLFAIVISYFFNTPKLGRDLSLALNFLILYFTFYVIIKDDYEFMRYICPYYNLVDFFSSNKFGLYPIKNNKIHMDYYAHFVQVCFYCLIIFLLDNFTKQNFTNLYLKIKNSFKQKTKRKSSFQKRIPNLQIKNLKKSFGNNKVLKGITLNFEKSKIYCLLGHNGAGKSTFINVLTGIEEKDSGEILWKDKEFENLNKNINIGICASYDILYHSLTIFEHLKIICLIKNIKKKNQKIFTLTKKLNLFKYINYKVNQLSGGNKRKLSLAISLISEPDLLFLDEPTSAIDSLSRQEIWGILKNFISKSNMIILLTTHHLEEAEYLADEIHILARGKIIVNGTVSDIKNKFGVGYSVFLVRKDNGEICLTEKDFIVRVLEQKIEKKNIFFDFIKIEIKIPLEDRDLIFEILNFIKLNFSKDYDFSINSNTLEKAYFEIEEKFQSENFKASDSDFKITDLNNLYKNKTTSLSKKIFLIIKNKFDNFFTDITEIIKTISIYTVIILTMGGTIKLIKEHFDIEIDISLIIIGIKFIYIIEISLYPFNGYNYLYEHSNGIKWLLYCNKISPFAYLLGKFIFDFIFNIFFYFIIFLSIGEYLKHELDLNYDGFKEKFYLVFFKFFIWKLTYDSFTYLLSHVFTQTKKFMKYYLFLYGFYGALIIKLNSMSGYRIFNYMSDTSFFFFIIDNPEFGYYNTLFFGSMIIFCVFTIILIKEYFFIKMNYLKYFVDFEDKLGVNKKIDKENENILEVKDLSKYYGLTNKTIALKKISFKLKEKINFGLIGPNGSGKTTFFKLLLSKKRKTSGEIKFSKLKTIKNIFQILKIPNIFKLKKIGVCFQTNTLWEYITVNQTLNFFCSLHKIQKKILKKIINYLNFNFYLKNKINELSSGNKRKLCIILSILINPEILLMDEATCGIDLLIRRKLKIIFTYFKKSNNAIGIFTTHFIKDIEIYCDKLGIIRKGEFLCVDYIDSLKNKMKGYKLNIKFRGEGYLEFLKTELKGFGKEIDFEVLEGEVNLMNCGIYGVFDIIELFGFLDGIKKQGKIFYFSINQLSVEDMYLRILKLKNN